MKIIIGLGLIIIGLIIGRISAHKCPIGDLRVDQSDPSCPPYLFLELDTDVYTIMRKKNVTFRVKLENLIPHK